MATLEPKTRVVRGVTKWCLDLRKHGGSRHFFDDETSARAFAGLKSQEIQDYGKIALTLTHQERIAFMRAKDRLAASGATIDDAVDCYFRHHAELVKMRFPDAMREFLAAKQKAGKRSEYVRLLSITLRQFSKHFPDKLCHDVSRKDVETWLDESEWQPVTKRSYLINLRTFFEFAKRRGWSKVNPCDGIDAILLDDKPPGILTVDQCRTLLGRCLKMDPKLAPFIAVQLFGGLRPVEARQLAKSEIGEDFLEVTGRKAKTRQRRLVSLNDTLKAWLAVGGDLPPKNWRRRLRRVRFDWAKDPASKKGKKKWVAAVPWSHDCLRHSFVSYHLAKFKDAARTALEAGHSETVLFKHYRELVKPKDAEAFWALRPSDFR